MNTHTPTFPLFRFLCEMTCLVGWSSMGSVTSAGWGGRHDNGALLWPGHLPQFLWLADNGDLVSEFLEILSTWNVIKKVLAGKTDTTAHRLSWGWYFRTESSFSLGNQAEIRFISAWKWKPGTSQQSQDGAGGILLPWVPVPVGLGCYNNQWHTLGSQ